MQLAFQPFDPAVGLGAQRVLLRDCFPEAIGQPAESLEHYYWKFHSAPSNPPSCEYGAILDGELIGYYAAIPYHYKIADRILTAGMVCDVMTGTKARGKGVFTKLGAYSLERMGEAGIDFVTGYPIRLEVIPGHLKVGWSVVQRLPVYIKVLRTTALLRGRRLGILAPLSNAAAAAATRLAALPGFCGYTATELSPDDFLAAEWYPRFLDRWIDSVPNALRKDPAFLRWRLGAPGTSYRIFVANPAAGDPVGVCIARPTSLHGLPTLALLDLMLLPGHTGAFRAIDDALQRFARTKGSEVIATMLSAVWAQRYRLRSLLYLRSPHVFLLIVKKLNAAVDDDRFFRPDVWHTMWIDSDDL